MKKKKASNSSIQIATDIKNGKLETTKVDVKVGSKFLIPIIPRIISLRTAILLNQTHVESLNHLKDFTKESKEAGIPISQLIDVIQIKESIDVMKLYKHLYKEYPALEGYGLGFNKSYSAVKIMDPSECVTDDGDEASFTVEDIQKDIDMAMAYVEGRSGMSKDKREKMGKHLKELEVLNMSQNEKMNIAEMMAESEIIMEMHKAGKSITKEQLGKVKASKALLDQLLAHVKEEGAVA